MKIDRLIGIIFILLQKEKVTACFLAEKFEVSVRTILRDIDDICKAGIPIATAQGRNGGISIMDGFCINHTLLTSSEIQAILTGIKGLDSICGTDKYKQIMNKIINGNSNLITSNNHILIDLSSWYKTMLIPKIEIIQSAINDNIILEFKYFSPKEESYRKVEPYLLLFKWSSWYLYGHCLLRNDYRLFKINRMLDLSITENNFIKRNVPDFNLDNDSYYDYNIHAVVIISKEMKWRVIDEFGLDSFTVNDDGNLLFEFDFMDKESLLNWILTFGIHAELIEPANLRDELYNISKTINLKYQND